MTWARVAGQTSPCEYFGALAGGDWLVLGSSLKVTDVETQPLTYVASYASKMLGHALDCGFTTVRDTRVSHTAGGAIMKGGEFVRRSS